MNGPNNPIGWCDYTWNPVTGCLNNCPYCYARKLANGRLSKRYLKQWNTIDALNYPFAPRFWPHRLDEPYKLKKPAKIFVCDMGELFGYWIPREWTEKVITVAQDNPRHIFQFLTKYPMEMKKFEFPTNCWCGTTLTQIGDIWRVDELLQTKFYPLHFISCEPLMGEIEFPSEDITELDWMIIGAETGNRKGKVVPQEEWIAHIIDQADYWNIPIFMKDNLKPHWHERLRQEFPKSDVFI